MQVIAGDIGGTKTLLCVFGWNGERLEPCAEHSYRSADYSGLAAILSEFLEEAGAAPRAAAFGLAGPVRDRRARITNLPWTVDADAIERELGLPSVRLLNDLEATAYGVLELDDDDLQVLNPGTPDPHGNRAVIAAGTGLGEAGMVWDGRSYRPFATEGGHGGFGPEDEAQRELLAFMARRDERVTWERVLSGSALPDLLAFVEARAGQERTAQVREEMEQGDPGAAITRAAAEGRCPLCGQTLELFVRLYGSEAGNLGLRMLATGGVYLAGGIAPKIAAALAAPGFLEAFRSKEPMESLVSAMPVKLVMNSRAALLGAARAATLA